MGPSQANPYTGELLNADVLIEADMMRRNAVAWYRSVRPLENADVDELLQERFEQWQLTPGSVEHEDLCQKNISQQLQASFGDMALASVSAAASGLPFSDEEEEEIVRQYLIALIAHEVGHTFGLRHNFAGSRMLSFEQLSDTSITRRQGMVSSIMEYDPITVMADRSKQGDYFSQNIGPYDVWAIQWGYSPQEWITRLRRRTSSRRLHRVPRPKQPCGTAPMRMAGEVRIHRHEPSIWAAMKRPGSPISAN